MEYSIQKLDKSVVEIAIKVEEKEWQDCIMETYKKTKGQYKVQGFRPGKVPYDVIVKRYGIEAFYSDAVDLGLDKYYSEILEKEKLDVVSKPEIDLHNVDEKGFNAVIKVEVYPEIDVKEYKGLTVKKVKSKYTKKSLDDAIDSKRNQMAKWIEVDRAAELNDKLALDYSGAIDGVNFDGGTAENQELVLGSGSFIPGFEDQLVGAVKDETRDVKVTFPKEYHSEDLAGKEAIFTCKVHAIMKKDLPKLDDEYAKDLGDFESFEEYKKDLEKTLKEQANKEAQFAEDDALINKIVENNVFDVPEGLVNQEIDRRINDLSQRYISMGISLDDFLKYTGKTMENLYDEFRDQSLQEVKTRIVLEAILSKEDIKVEKEEFDKELEEIAKSTHKDFEELKKTIDQNMVMGIMNKVLVDKLLAFLRKSNTFA